MSISIKHISQFLALATLIIIFLLHPLLSTTGQSNAQDSDPIRIGSKEFAENITLAYLIYYALEDAGFVVEDNTVQGGSVYNREALLSGELDVFPEYTGTALVNWFQNIEWFTPTEEVLTDPFASYQLVSSLDAVLNDVIWLNTAPFNNSFGLAVRQDFADTHELVTVADLARFVNNGGQVTLASNEEFAYRADGLTAFEQTYSFFLDRSNVIVINSAIPTQTRDALLNDSGPINLAMVYTSDGYFTTYNLAVLEDPLNAQPAFYPAPIFRGEVIRNNPEIVGILNPIFESIDIDTMRALNQRAEVNGELPAQIAQDYLREMDFINE